MEDFPQNGAVLLQYIKNKLMSEVFHDVSAWPPDLLLKVSSHSGIGGTESAMINAE